MYIYSNQQIIYQTFLESFLHFRALLRSVFVDIDCYCFLVHFGDYLLVYLLLEINIITPITVSLHRVKIPECIHFRVLSLTYDNTPSLPAYFANSSQSSHPNHPHTCPSPVINHLKFSNHTSNCTSTLELSPWSILCSSIHMVVHPIMGLCLKHFYCHCSHFPFKTKNFLMLIHTLIPPCHLPISLILNTNQHNKAPMFPPLSVFWKPDFDDFDFT